MSEDKKLYLYTLNSEGTIIKDEYFVIQETTHYLYFAQNKDFNSQRLMAPHIQKNQLDQPERGVSIYKMCSFSDKESYAAEMFANLIKKERDDLLKKSEQLELLAKQITCQYAEKEEVERE